VEPVRVEDAFQRRGLAKTMVIEGVRRLVECGTLRVKVSYGNRAAQHLYEGIGFVTTDSTTWFTKEVATPANATPES
jgi:ribosomal protein S18 acetylase RimI-like enzyme